MKEKKNWAIDASKTTSSSWRSLLSLRGLSAGFLKVKLGNGQQISFWYDQWMPLGPFIKLFGLLGLRELQIDISASVSQACNSDGWLLRGARSPAAEELQTHLTTVYLPTLRSEQDTYVWVVDGVELQDFSTRKTWNMVKNMALEQSWIQNIWFKGHIPRQAFTAWVAFQDRLPTRSRLVEWGMNISPSRCLCSMADENKEHLFLHCEISESVRSFVLTRLGYSHRGFHTWTALSKWTVSRDMVVRTTLKRAATQITISSLWSERNKRLHDGISQTPAARRVGKL